MTIGPTPLHSTPVDDAEAAFVRRLSREVGSEAEPRLIGEGFGNWVYRVEVGGRGLALKLAKPHRVSATEAEFATEFWCGAAAREMGVPTPEMVVTGSFEERPYLVQAYALGHEPTDGEHELAWAAMGAWARTFHQVPVSGWGPRCVGDGIFSGSWPDHLAYNIDALGDNDPLAELGVLNAATSDDVRRRFERLASKHFRIGLCHADLAPRNVLMRNGQAAVLLDWELGRAAPVPHYDINEIIRSKRGTAYEIDVFRLSYGLSDTEFAEIKADLPDLLALRDIDTLRWALDRSPANVERLAKRAKRTVASLRGPTSV